MSILFVHVHVYVEGEEREGMAAHLMAWTACFIPFSLEGLGSFRMKRLVSEFHHSR